MQTDTQLTGNLRAADSKASYDAAAKRILANKEILAWILRECTEEFKNCSIQDIAYKYIEKEPEISSVAVDSDMSDHLTGETIIGMNTEDKTINDGTIYYDIRFSAAAPCGDSEIKLIINIEAQKDAHPGYALVTRGLYYCARMLSAQNGREFVPPHYENIKKVYSIWVCSQPPASEHDAITKYFVGQEYLKGHSSAQHREYDLLSVIIINLNDKISENPNSMVDLLSIALSDTINYRQKVKVMNNNYNITMTRKLEGDVSIMCNLSDGVWKKVHAEGEAKGKILGTIDTYREIGLEHDEMMAKIIKKFSITPEEAEQYLAEARSNS